MGLYYGKVWEAMKFPFLSPHIFSAKSTASAFEIYNQTSILSPKFELDGTKLASQGLQFFTATHAAALLTTNLGTAATFVHIFLWNREVVADVLTFDYKKVAGYLRSPSLLWKQQPAPVRTEEELVELDPHYRSMLAYKEVPPWWYASILLGSTALA